MSSRSSKKRPLKIEWKEISDRLSMDPNLDYDTEIEWLKENMCKIATKLYKTHIQPVPACHQSAHYIYLGVSIFKKLRENPHFVTRHSKATSQKEIFEKLMSHAIYENQRYLFLLSDSNYQKSHRWFYVCPEELNNSGEWDGNYLLLCIDSDHGNNTESCSEQKKKQWINENNYPSEIGVGHYGFLSLNHDQVHMTSSWVTVSTIETQRRKEIDVVINRPQNEHEATLEEFQQHVVNLALPLKERAELTEKPMKDALNFIGAISRYDPLLKTYVRNALLKRDKEAFAEYMKPIIVVLIKIENLPVEFEDSQGEEYMLEDAILLPTPKSKHQEYDYDTKRQKITHNGWVEGFDKGGKPKKRTVKKSYRK